MTELSNREKNIHLEIIPYDLINSYKIYKYIFLYFHLLLFFMKFWKESIYRKYKEQKSILVC
jgi:hypothetical protein